MKKVAFIYAQIFRKTWGGFTLAEVLISIAVIGVVATIMIPAMNYLIQTKVREHQVSVAKQKFNKAAEVMTLNGEMGPYYSDTENFVNELQKHLKIIKVCRVGNNPSNLPPVTDCFGEKYTDVTLTDGTTFPLSNIKTGAEFKLTNDDNNDWSSDNIAFTTIDGVRMLVSYNKKCLPVEPGVYTGNTSHSCLSGLVDVDGDKKPNTLGKDVYLFGSARSIGNACAFGGPLGLCYSVPIGTYEAVHRLDFTEEDCVNNAAE